MDASFNGGIVCKLIVTHDKTFVFLTERRDLTLQPLARLPRSALEQTKGAGPRRRPRKQVEKRRENILVVGHVVVKSIFCFVRNPAVDVKEKCTQIQSNKMQQNSLHLVSLGEDYRRPAYQQLPNCLLVHPAQRGISSLVINNSYPSVISSEGDQHQVVEIVKDIRSGGVKRYTANRKVEVKMVVLQR